MFSGLWVSFLGVVISLLVMVLGSLMAKRALKDREKGSAFECGFDPMNTARLPFSLRFFLLAIIFLIFDVEIVLLFPVLSSVSLGVSSSLMCGVLLFLIILLIGLIHEWREGSLDWL